MQHRIKKNKFKLTEPNPLMIKLGGQEKLLTQRFTKESHNGIENIAREVKGKTRGSH